MIERLNLLKENGLKLTKQRAKILEALEAEDALSAEDILKCVEPECRVNLSTIYRNLSILLKMGIIRKSNRSEQADYFELVRHRCTHPLLCLGCGERINFSECAFDQIVRDIEQSTHYQIKYHNFELYGMCPKCGQC